ncbi:MAG: hypothetical protein U0P30_05060 [Vicinamibacterales bacterium]
MNTRHPLDDAILQAVTYAALFDYPLTLAQLRETLPLAAGEEAVAARLASSEWLRAVVSDRGGLVYPAGRDDLPGIRRRREAITLPRLRGDAPAIAFVSGLPFVRAVAISGSLAHLNADDGEATGDLDLFVVTAPGRVWMVTVVALVVARLRGWRRRLCLNYVVSERALEVPSTDLFTANQIVHLRPLSGEATYRRFLDANPCVGTHYPNFVPRPAEAAPVDDGVGAAVLRACLTVAAPVLEPLSRALYGWHLRRRSARWTTRDGVRLDAECLKLHTSSHRDGVLRRYEAALDAARAAADAATRIASVVPLASAPMRRRRPA